MPIINSIFRRNISKNRNHHACVARLGSEARLGADVLSGGRAPKFGWAHAKPAARADHNGAHSGREKERKRRNAIFLSHSARLEVIRTRNVLTLCVRAKGTTVERHVSRAISEEPANGASSDEGKRRRRAKIVPFDQLIT